MTVSAKTIGQVIMLRERGAWAVWTDAGRLEISHSQSGGLQEAIDYAHAHCQTLTILGGEQSADGSDSNAIVSDTPIFIPAGAKGVYVFCGVTLWFRGSNDNSNLGLVFDSMDMLDFDFSGQIVYPGNASAVTIMGRTPFKEGADAFTVVTSSRIRIGSVAIVEPSGKPRPSNGTALAIVGPAPVTFNEIEIREINGGVRPYWIADSTFFGWNRINLLGIHNVGEPGIQRVNHAPNRIDTFGPN